MKPSRVKEHLTKKHSNKTNKNILYFNDLKNKFEKRIIVSGISNKVRHNHNLLAFYKVPHLVAKCGKPHTIVDTQILPAMEAILNSMTSVYIADKLALSISLNNNSVQAN